MTTVYMTAQALVKRYFTVFRKTIKIYLQSPRRSTIIVPMEFEFAHRKLERLYVDRNFSAKMSPGLVKAFREAMDTIRDALDERDFYALKSLHFERLSARRSHLHSMRLNDQYRLIVSLVEQEGRRKRVSIIAIEDYH